jgi:hypothetical protein
MTCYPLSITALAVVDLIFSVMNISAQRVIVAHNATHLLV